jgi:hypothetical protein
VQLAALAVVALLGAFLVYQAIGSGDDEPSAAGARLAFAEFGTNADRIYVAPVDDLNDRDLVATVEHASQWALTPSPQLGGTLLAYTVLSPDAPAVRDSPAELWVLDLVDGERTRLAGDADLLVAPIFNAAGSQLTYRRSEPDGTQSLVRVDIETRARTVIRRVATDFGVFPIIATADGTLVYAQLSLGGTDLYRVRAGEAPELVHHASDEIARDWRASPDGRSISFVAPEVSAERVVYRLHVVALDGGGEVISGGAEAGPLVEQFSPVWSPQGDAVTVGREAGIDEAAGATTLVLGDGAIRTLAAPERGFDVPLGWSPDGRYLAARSFDGVDATEPGRETLVVIDGDGGEAGVRHTVTAASELIFLGWLARG